LWTTKMRKQCTMLEIEDSLLDKSYSQVYPYVSYSYCNIPSKFIFHEFGSWHIWYNFNL